MIATELWSDITVWVLWVTLKPENTDIALPSSSTPRFISTVQSWSHFQPFGNSNSSLSGIVSLVYNHLNYILGCSTGSELTALIWLMMLHRTKQKRLDNKYMNVCYKLRKWHISMYIICIYTCYTDTHSIGPENFSHRPRSCRKSGLKLIHILYKGFMSRISVIH